MKKVFMFMLAAGMILLLVSCGRFGTEKMTFGEFVGHVLGGRDTSEKSEKPLGYSENEDSSSMQAALQEAGSGGESRTISRAVNIKNFIQTCYRQLSVTIQEKLSNIRSQFFRHGFK